MLLRSMNGKLVMFDNNSSGSGKVAALLTTLEATVLVIVPKVRTQSLVRLKRLGTVTTISPVQVAMLIMGPQLFPKKTTLVKCNDKVFRMHTCLGIVRHILR